MVNTFAAEVPKEVTPSPKFPEPSNLARSERVWTVVPEPVAVAVWKTRLPGAALPVPCPPKIVKELPA
jgi:hypothetical protein